MEIMRKLVPFPLPNMLTWTQLNNVVLDARDKQLRIGALGEFDSYWNDSNQRMESVTTQVRDPTASSWLALIDLQLVAGRGRVAVLLYECLSLTGTHQMGFGVEYGHSNNASNNAHRNCNYRTSGSRRRHQALDGLSSAPYGGGASGNDSAAKL